MGPPRKRYACLCCGYLTLEEEPPGTYDICEVCGWEDDPVQAAHPDYEGGANRESLNQAREAFREFHRRFQSGMGRRRAPLPEEIPSGHESDLKKNRRRALGGKP